MPRSNLFRALKQLEIEEKILNAGSAVALLGVFMPWFGGLWFGEPTAWSGFGFYTSFMGLLIFLSHAFILSVTLLPLLGYQVFRKTLRDLLRLIIGLECVLLTILVWSVLTNVAFEHANMEIRFGIYLTLVGSIIVSLYSFLKVQEQRKRAVQDLFHHPEEVAPAPREEVRKPVETTPPPPPPPPPAPEPEEPRLFS